MKLVLQIALSDLFKDRLALLCNVAVICGIMLPLMVLLGAKSGVGNYLIDQLETDPEILSISSAGSVPLPEDTLDKILSWPGVEFAVPSPRAFTDSVTLMRNDPREIRSTIALTSGTGDPLLGAVDLALPPMGMAVTSDLAQELSLSLGIEVSIMSQLPKRPKQLLIPMVVSVVLPPTGLRGDTILVNPSVLDTMEAFIDNYALPDYGFPEGRDPAKRVVQWEKVRVQAATLRDVAGIEARMRTELGLRTRAETGQIEGTLGLISGLNGAFRMLAIVSLIGLVAALSFAFWASVNAKRVVLAMLSVMGLGHRHLMLFPVIQALATMGMGLLASIVLYLLAKVSADWILGRALGIEGLLQLGIAGTAGMVGIGLFIAVFAAVGAVWQTRRTDPAIVLRAGV